MVANANFVTQLSNFLLAYLGWTDGLADAVVTSLDIEALTLCPKFLATSFVLSSDTPPRDFFYGFCGINLPSWFSLTEFYWFWIVCP